MDPHPLRDWAAWPGPVPELEMPATVGSLTCFSQDCTSMHSNVDRPECLDLYALLAMAAHAISSGVQLSKLRLAHCATFVRELTPGNALLLEPSERELAGMYRPMSRTLHGLTGLDLSHAPRCELRAVAEVVRSAPDLKDLHLWVPPVLSTYHMPRTAIPCSGLKRLTLACGLRDGDPRLPDELLDLEYVLEDTSCLECITVELTAWQGFLPNDTVAMHLTCRAGSAVTCTVAEALCHKWELRVVLEASLDHPPAQSALVSFCWEADRGWVRSIGYE